jgi:hypothetical protein
MEEALAREAGGWARVIFADRLLKSAKIQLANGNNHPT